jgi:CRISPR-associated protein Csb2
MQLRIKLTFADRRYHGRRSEDELEFPPSPSRLFQALIAGGHCGAYGVLHTDERDRALRWLESLEPPLIEAPAACETGADMTNYVPNNDNLREHVRTAKSFLGKVFPGEHSLVYRWNFQPTQTDRENAAVICSMAKLITHLGQHQDTVYASGEVSEDATSSDGLMVPTGQGDGDWSAPQAGSLEAYRLRYQAWLRGDSKDNVTVPAQRVHYRAPGTISFAAPMALFEMWRDEDERLRFDPRELRRPAAMVRHAMIEWVKARPAFIRQYEADKQHDGAHIACVPLPSLNAEGQADGLIRRVLLIGFGCEDDASRELFESVVNGINGADLKDRSSKVGYLKQATLNDSLLRQYSGKGQRVWRTVTPIILTGLMRRGRGAEVLIARALRQAGVNETDIESVAAFSGPIVPKTVHALDYQIDRASYLAQTPRYHAEVIFRHPVEGILVIGRGRHCGFGLLMPCLANAPEYRALEK